MKDVRAFYTLFALLRREQPDVIHLNSSKAAGLGALAARVYLVSCILQAIVRHPMSPISKVKRRRNNVAFSSPKVVHESYSRTSDVERGRPHNTQYKIQNTRIIITLHGLPHIEPRPILQKWLIKLFTWFTVLLSHKTITVSRHDYEIIRKWPFCRNRAEMVHNGIDAIDFTQRAHARSYLTGHIQNTKYEIQDTSFVIGTIAELHPNKGLDTLIEAIALLQKIQDTRYKIQTYIVGEGELRDSLASLIAACGLGEHVVLAGEIENAARLLPAFDLFVLPSRKEGLPYVLIEALHAGVPVIATRVGGIPEIVVHEETGLLVAPGDSAALAEAIARLARDGELREYYATNARAHASLFSHEKMITETYTLYGRHI